MVVANISGKGTFGAVNVDLIFENTHHFAGSAEKALGNMLADDRLGSHLTKFCLINKEGACQEPGPGGMELQGDYGLLTIQAGGDYAYVPRRDLRAIGRTDTFDYELHHPNGEVAEASLTIRIGEAPFHGGVETDTVPVEDQTLLPSAPQETTVSDPLAHLARPTEDDLAPISSDV